MVADGKPALNIVKLQQAEIFIGNVVDPLKITSLEVNRPKTEAKFN